MLWKSWGYLAPLLGISKRTGETGAIGSCRVKTPGSASISIVIILRRRKPIFRLRKKGGARILTGLAL
jgi:hypothetical protein